MVRWAYLVPRIVILALITLAVWVGSDPLIHRVVLSNLQNATGAKVDIGHLRYSLSNQKAYLKELAFADPRLPMRNLLQAEMAYLELDADRLLHRQVVIERGEASRVVFGAPRTVSGDLPGFPTPLELEEFEWNPREFGSIEEIGLAWLDQLPANNTTALTVENLELVQIAQELSGQWKTQLRSLTESIATLKQERTDLSKATSDDGNPLRRNQVNAKSGFEKLAQQSKSIQARLIDLERVALSDRDRLSLAFSRDFHKVRQSFAATSFESDSVSKLLLTEFQEKRVSEIVGWFKWFRSVVPDPETDFQPKRQRGENLRLPGIDPKPGFLIKSIDVEGEGRFANRHMNFAGIARNLTSAPTLHDQPASFELRAQGDQHLIVSCTLDRRDEMPIDSLNVVCPDMELDEQLLGEKNSMLVTMGPANRIQADIQINATGNQLSGELVFRHSNVSLHVDKLHEIIGGSDAALRLNQGLASVDRFETRVTLSGTIDDYDYQFQSDLGSRFANAANQLLDHHREQEIELRKNELEKLLAKELMKLNNEILPEIRKLGALLEQERVEIASRQNSQSQGQGRLPKIH